MDIQTVTVELLRAGPRHNQLISPITQYLGICGNSPATRVTLPYEHGDVERRLQELRYTVTSTDDKRRTRQVLDQMGREIAQVLAGIDGVEGMLAPKSDRPPVLTHLRIVLSASELAMLPFEATKVPSLSGAGSGWLALQARAPVCITRHIRSVSADAAPWPTAPRILFVVGPDTPFDEHRAALERVLAPWRNAAGAVSDLLTVLQQPRLADINRALHDAAAAGKPFTHVHVLAHGQQVDPGDRYSPTGVLLRDPQPGDGDNAADAGTVTGDRLASALTAICERGPCRPTVVTLATCDSGRVADVRTTDAGIAHHLHDSGIPLVVASQFPLTVDGSIPFVERFYDGQLRGEHPLQTLYAVRLDLHTRMDLDTHDWASLVVYEALPTDLADQLQDLRYWQMRRAQDAALKRLEAVPKAALSPAQAQPAYADALLDARARVADLPGDGPYALECAGLRAAAYKRIGLAAAELARAAGPGDAADAWLKECRQQLEAARAEYWRAARGFLGPSSADLRRKSNLHWLLGQVLSLDVARGQQLDLGLWMTARLAANIDLESPAEDVRAWAHVSLTEFELLRLADPQLLPAERQAHAGLALEHARRFIGLVGASSEHVQTTARQIDRYVAWWGNDDIRWLLARLGVPEHPHWQVEHGLLETAQALVALLRGPVVEPMPGPRTAPAQSLTGGGSGAAAATPARARKARTAG